MIKVSCLTVALAAIFLLAFANSEEFDTEHTWVAGHLSLPFPRNAVLGGVSTEGHYVYVGRVKYFGAFPVQVKAETGEITWNNGTYAYVGTKNYEILVSSDHYSFEWVSSHDGKYERGLVASGTSSINERIFVCRAITPSGQLPGTLILSLKGCRVAGSTVKYDKYEVLVAR
ncbi:uncharacterized protein LOC128253498 [Drosophila gunungcola]|uniref:Uncharacterized protein n=1 Tax=Drosophila gunungcola TaxID=103775 RepID=A0A9P9YE60_9MUSC|nr:uncharacterized protein LOC128253498 [Drosophila gunungcola]KAI8035364.1 hypothetical protein M5D96_011807 [Drosophila gunungcola]